MKEQTKMILLIAAAFVFLDYVFHLFLTTPMEVPEYFVAKFIIASLSAYILVKYLKKFTYINIAIASAIHSTIASGYYYFLTIYGYKTIFPEIIGVELYVNDIAGWVVHLVLFFAAVIIVLRYLKIKVRK